MSWVTFSLDINIQSQYIFKMKQIILKFYFWFNKSIHKGHIYIVSLNKDKCWHVFGF